MLLWVIVEGFSVQVGALCSVLLAFGVCFCVAS